MRRFLGFSFCSWVLCAPLLLAQTGDPPMNTEELSCLQQMIFFNECSGREERMLTWRTDEDFPSFGLGHFIWYPAGIEGPYQEFFPDFLRFLEAQKEPIPEWITALPERKAPWKTREEFLADASSERMRNLREFLLRTQGFQTQFIIRRVEGLLPKILAAVPEEDRPEIELKFKWVADAPKGMFALIDYVNFKGEGILESEQSQGQGWGLRQVLEEMRLPEEKEDALEEFVRAAVKILENRVRNSPPERDLSEPMRGWRIRVKSYLKIHC